MNRSGSQFSQFEMVEKSDSSNQEEVEEVEEEEAVEEEEEEEEELVEEEVEVEEEDDEAAPEELETPAVPQLPQSNTTQASVTSLVDKSQAAVAAAPPLEDKPSAGAQPGEQPAQSEPSPSEQQAPQDDASFAALRALEAQVFDKFSTLQGGFKSALSQLGSAQTVTEATSSLSKLAGGWTSGLTSSMGWLTGNESAAASKVRAMQLQTSKVGNELQTLFGLDDTEQLVESFKCKLLQTYACAHNSYTPAIQMAFQGTLHITDQHVCFGVEERGKQLPIKVPLKSITASSRQLPVQKGTSDVLKLELQGGKHIAFKDFESGGGALDSALALIEHLTVSDS